MFLENVVTDAVDPRALGRFWEAALGGEQLTDEAAGYETRFSVPDGPVLDLGFQRVGEPPTGPERLTWVLRGGEDPEAVVARLVDLGARPAGYDGSPTARRTTLTDPAGNRFLVDTTPAADVDGGPVAALSLEVADPLRERDFWAWLTGWAPVEEGGSVGLRHPSHRGPLLELLPEAGPKGAGKNRMHLDVRLEPGDDADAVCREVLDRGGRELTTDWGDLPWRSFLDPSGNELCLLPSRG